MRYSLAIALVVSPFLLAGAEDRTKRSVTAQPGGRLVLEAEIGAIKVEPGSSNSVEVEVYRRVDAPSQEESERILRDFDLELTQQGSEVVARGIFKTGWKPQSEVPRNGRRICRNDGTLYHVDSNPPKSPGICDRCGAALIQREDDTEAVIRKRLEVYTRETLPAASLYRERGILVEVDAGGNASAVFERLKAGLAT